MECVDAKINNQKIPKKIKLSFCSFLLFIGYFCKKLKYFFVFLVDALHSQPKQTKMIIANLILKLINILYAVLDWLGVERPLPPKKKHHLALCRERKNDVWLTPECVAKDHIEWTRNFTLEPSTWLDPYRNTGNYYNNFPEDQPKDWAEILQGKDAMDLDYNEAIVCSNPPYSLLGDHLKRFTMLGAQTISVLVMTNHITTPRLAMMKERGYTLAGMKFYNIKGYMNTAVAICWVATCVGSAEWEDHVDLDFEYERGGFIAEGEPIRERQD